MYLYYTSPAKLQPPFFDIVIVAVALSVYFYLSLGCIYILSPVEGQAEETFALNSTFLREIEQNETRNTIPGESATKNDIQKDEQLSEIRVAKAPMVISGDNAYIVWSTNETGNWEVMFRGSNDWGETFRDKLNLSNSTEKNSQNAEIVAAGDKVMVSWQEIGVDGNLTNYYLRTSGDGGQTFGPLLQLSANGSIGDRDSNFLTYENPDFGVQIKYPDDWDFEDLAREEATDGVGNLASFFSPFETRLDDYSERLFLSVDVLQGQNMTIEEYSAQVVTHNNGTLGNFRLLDRETDSVLLSGYPAYRIISTQQLEDGRIVRQMEIGTIVNDVVYYVTYYAEENKYREFLPIAQEMVNSLQIEG